MSETLVGVSLASLTHLRDAAAQSKVVVPLVDLHLRERGFEPQVAGLLVRVLGELSREPLLSVLDTLIAERERAERERPRLLWTGPEAPGSGALDTRVELLELLGAARTSVFWAGYRFDDTSLVEPLYEAMCQRRVDVTVVLEVQSDKDDGLRREQRIAAAVDDFLGNVWTWKDLRPRLFVDPRTAGWNSDPGHPRGGYFALMHAKAVIVDAEHCIVGSANFTDAGTTRNIEVGVLLRNREFARTLLGQWHGLISNRLLREVG
jgi:phosphatidylserine/phosphatidylglycerophosphate/cardiolipin synthase-like enzyme